MKQLTIIITILLHFNLSAQYTQDYINKYSSIAVIQMDKYKIPASITLALAVIKSKCGNSVLSIRNNNHFGVKCFSKSCSKGHCENYAKVCFRNYKTIEESFNEHSKFLILNKYKSLVGKNYKEWAVGLRECGYSTDVNLDKKIISLIESYELYKLDNL